LTSIQPTSGHGGNARFDEEVTAMTPGPTSDSRADRLVLDVEDESQDDALIDGIIEWIKERDPEFFLPEDD
jgi:hypothetical protein